MLIMGLVKVMSNLAKYLRRRASLLIILLIKLNIVTKKLLRPITKKYKKIIKFFAKSKFRMFGASICCGVFFASLIFIVNGGLVNAVTKTWDFLSSSDYLFDSNLVESNGSSVRLKAQNYSIDADTALLLHGDSASESLVLDESDNHNNATLVGNATIGLGKLNDAILLNGDGDYLTVPDSSSLTLAGAQSFEAWTKLDSAFSNTSPANQTIIDKGNYKLYYDKSSGKINYEIAGGDQFTWQRKAGQAADGAWDTDYKNTVIVETDGNMKYAGLGGLAGSAEVWAFNGSKWTKIGGDGINSSWAADTYENVSSIIKIGNNLYAGLGSSIGDAEVWSCNTTSNCSSWAKVGGDGVNSSWTGNYTNVSSLVNYNGNICAGLLGGTGLGLVYCYNGSVWTKIGGDTSNSSWDSTHEAVRSLIANGTDLYAGLGWTATDAEVWKYNGSSWTKIGGDGVAGSWAATDNIESVYSLDFYGGNLYAGTGLTGGDADVWKFDGSSWIKIGGDGVNSGWPVTAYEMAFSLTNDGTNLYAGLALGNGDGEIWKWSGTAWAKIGGDGANSGWSTADGDYIYSLDFDGTKIVAGVVNADSNVTKSTAFVWEWDGSNWSQTGGDYVNNSWGNFLTDQSIKSNVTLNGDLYVGSAGSTDGDALVWKYNGSTWQLIGGQGINNSWPINTYKQVNILEAYNSQICAGLGSKTGDAEVWCFNGSDWSKIGGDGVNSSWNNNYEAVVSSTIYDGKLCVGLGTGSNDAEVWCHSGSSWTRIGGIATGFLISGNTFKHVFSLNVYKSNLYALLYGGIGGSNVVLYKYNGSTWSNISSDAWASASASDAAYSNYNLVIYNNKLTIAKGGATGDADIWQYDGTNWSQFGGDGIAGSWSDMRLVHTLLVNNGELYAGLYNFGGSVDQLWKYNGTTWSRIENLFNNFSVGDRTTLFEYNGSIFQNGVSLNYLEKNKVLSSNQSSQDTNWHHIAATYDGFTMKLYIDGTENASKNVSVSAPDNNFPLLIGSDYGGKSAGYFDGMLDEVRISKTARSKFNSKPYVDSKPTVTLKNADYKTGVKRYIGFLTDETTNGGSVSYRLSNDDGASWLYWNTDSWVRSDSVSKSNSASVINDHIAVFPTTFDGIKWQAILTSDGNQRVTINSVTIEADADITRPSLNADNIVAKKVFDGDNLAASVPGTPSWTNGSSPYFNWDEGHDADSGILGYCLYLGHSDTANPESTPGLLSDNSNYYADKCQHVVKTNNVNLATAGVLSSPLVTSSDPYYLLIKAIDKAGNVYDESASFSFHFDNTPPTNPAFIYAPAGFISNKAATLTWLTSGQQSASDGASLVAGLQYKINNSVWYGDSHTGQGNSGDLLVNDGNYTMLPTPDFDNINDGVNIISFRTWDNAGNISTSNVTAALKVNTTGAPSEPLGLSVDHLSNTVNEFSFSWQTPQTFIGDANNLNYCYSINILPSVDSCQYTGAGGKMSLDSGPYATQFGQNTFYLIAKDESGRVNYQNYSSINFSANTTAPGIVGNVDIVDMSIKSSKKWRLAVTWDEPAEVGAGVKEYSVYRSTDNKIFGLVGTSMSTTYIDSGLSQKTYYYYAVACDSANHCSAESPVVSMYPTGKFTEPALLVSEPQTSDITTKRAKIFWVTDRPSDSKIAIGTMSGKYSESEVGSSSQDAIHQISLDNLAAGTTYYCVARWTDEDGNTGVSQEFTFTTLPAPVVKEILPIKIGLSTATIQFTSVSATKANLYYGESDSFGGLQSINTSVEESTYNIGLEGLKDGTKYFMMVSAFDSEGTEYRGNVFSFTTPPRPKILNLRFQPVDGEPTSTQSVTWTTNVLTDSTITYGKVGTSGTDVILSEPVIDHKMVIRGLDDNSEYFLIAQGRDVNGNLAVSDRQNFKTALDTRPPTISGINVETSIRGTGSAARGQVIVSWKTDEPATSQVAYAEGSNATEYNNRSSEDVQLTTEHIVILSDLRTSTVYSIKPLSYDKARNVSYGESQPVVVGRAKESIITIVFTTLQRVFGI